MDDGLSIAVIGLACRFPGAPDAHAYWRSLRDGVEAVRRLGPSELREVDPALRHDPHFVPVGAPLEDADRFDHEHFGIPLDEARLMDPQHRLFLETAWTALENAGRRPDVHAERVGCFAGAGMSLYAGTANHSYFSRYIARRPDAVRGMLGPQVIVGVGPDYLATRVAYRLDLRGPALSVQTACSTSLTAVHLAAQSLLAGECSTALAGAAAVHTPLATGYLWSEGAMFSRTGRCRPFDADADGLVGGCGVGVVVLRRLEDALRDGDPIRAILRGTAVNNDGRAKSSYMAPSVEGQIDVLTAALGAANVTPDTVSYVEAHGTATPMGDPLEVSALAQVFGGLAPASIGLGSVKGNIGHLDTAAGIASLIKTILALEARTLPPTLHFRRPNPELRIERTPFYVVDRATPWQPRSGVRRAGVSALGAGGTNVHVIVEEAPARRRIAAPSRPIVYRISARTPELVREAARRHASALRTDDVDLEAAEATLALGRRPFSHRLAVAGADHAEIAARLTELAESPATEVDASGGTVWVLPGQGATRAPCVAELARWTTLAAVIERCEPIFAQELGVSVRAVVDGTSSLAEADTRRVQALSLVIGVASGREWFARGLLPRAIVGHSVGEFAALVLAGSLSLDEAARIVAIRARAMARAEGGMVAIEGEAEQLAHILIAHPSLEIAAENAPDVQVVAGPRTALDALIADARARRLRAIPLAVSGAYHSRAVDDAAEEIAAACASVRFAPPEWPVISTLTGEPFDPNVDPQDYVRRHTRQRVRFQTAVARAAGSARCAIVELGVSSGLGNLAARCADASIVRTTFDREGRAHWEATLATLWMNGADIRATYDRARVALPATPFAKTRVWIDPPTTSPYVEIAWRASTDTRAPREPGDWSVLGDDAYAAQIVGMLPGGSRQRSASEAWRGRHVVLIASESLDASPFERVRAVLQPIVAACAALEQQSPRSIAILTSGGLGTPTADAAHAAVVGFARALRRELATVPVRVIDRGPDANVERVVEALLDRTDEAELRVTGHAIEVPRLRAVASAPGIVRCDGAFLITGGTGALGMHVAEWLLARGVRTLRLIARRAPDASIAARIAAWNATGADVRAVAADVAVVAELAAIVEELAARGERVRGVVHAAGELFDCTVARLTAERLTHALRAKVSGLAALETVLQNEPVERWILFSSVAALFGSAGQAAYCAANAYLDAIAAARDDVSGARWLSVQWGPFGGAGMADRTGARAHVRTGALETIEPEAIAAHLDELLGFSGAVACAPLEAAVHARAVESGCSPADAASLAFEDRATARPVSRDPLEYLLAFIASFCGAAMPATASLADCRLDSVGVLQLRNRLERDLGVTAPIGWFYAESTIEELAGSLRTLAADASPAPRSRLEMLKEELLRELEDDDCDRTSLN